MAKPGPRASSAQPHPPLEPPPGVGSEWTGAGSECTGPGLGCGAGCGLGAGDGLGAGAALERAQAPGALSATRSARSASPPAAGARGARPVGRRLLGAPVDRWRAGCPASPPGAGCDSRGLLAHGSDGEHGHARKGGAAGGARGGRGLTGDRDADPGARNRTAATAAPLSLGFPKALPPGSSRPPLPGSSSPSLRGSPESSPPGSPKASPATSGAPARRTSSRSSARLQSPMALSNRLKTGSGRAPHRRRPLPGSEPAASGPVGCPDRYSGSKSCASRASARSPTAEPSLRVRRR